MTDIHTAGEPAEVIKFKFKVKNKCCRSVCTIDHIVNSGQSSGLHHMLSYKPFLHSDPSIVLEWRLSITPALLLFLNTEPNNTGVMLPQCDILDGMLPF